MKYICNVKEGKLIKHIIEISGKNVEVTDGVHDYTKIEGYQYNDVEINKETLNVRASNKSLAEIVLACELVKFIKECGK